MADPVVNSYLRLNIMPNNDFEDTDIQAFVPLI